MARNGQTDEATAQALNRGSAALNRRTLGGVVAYVSVTKSMLYILRDAVKNEEVLVAADDALRELEHLEQHPDNLRRLFRRQYGISPSEYRQGCRQNLHRSETQGGCAKTNGTPSFF